VRFRLVSKSMTLNDLELVKGQTLSKLCPTLRFRETTTAKRMQIDPHTSEKNVRQRLQYKLIVPIRKVAPPSATMAQAVARTPQR